MVKYMVGQVSKMKSAQTSRIRTKGAAFVDGDFLHGRDWPKRKSKGQFKNQKRFWMRKIKKNIKRDRQVILRLKPIDWLAPRIWAPDVDVDGIKFCKQVYLQVNRHLKRKNKKNLIMSP